MTRTPIEAFPSSIDQPVIITDPVVVHHLAVVLRLAVGDEIDLFDTRGLQTRAQVTSITSGKKPQIGCILSAEPQLGITCDAARVHWLQGVPKGDKLEQIVRQATELGVSTLSPVLTARSVARPHDHDTRRERLIAVARSASAQCGRADVPQVAPFQSLNEALVSIPVEATLRIVPWEEGGAHLLDVIARCSGSVGCAVLVGPEGGLQADEVALARSHGFTAVTLGPRILRTETVAPALLSVLSATLGDLAQR